MTIDTFITLLIQELNANRQFGTSHIYKSTQASFQKYLSCRAVGFEELNQTMICQYELWLS
ncbi:MAG: phage integrase SAM-like domain-containing protein, partial [Bacteroidaceae bacterium]